MTVSPAHADFPHRQTGAFHQVLGVNRDLQALSGLTGVRFRVGAGWARHGGHDSQETEALSVVYGTGEGHRLGIGCNAAAAHSGLDLDKQAEANAGGCGRQRELSHVCGAVHCHADRCLRCQGAQAAYFGGGYNRACHENVVKTCRSENLGLTQGCRGDTSSRRVPLAGDGRSAG